MLSVKNKPNMLCVVTLNVIILSVVAAGHWTADDYILGLNPSTPQLQDKIMQ